MTIAVGDSVTIEYTGRLDDGAVFDTSRESVAEETGLAEQRPDRDYEPLTVEVGAEKLIEGMEEALIGLDEGDTPTVAIPPEKGYGEWTEERVQEYDADELSRMLGDQAPEEGIYLETQAGDLGTIVAVGDDVVRVDFNPRLAGETLEFDIEVLDVDGN
ncbi:MAG: peptidylprolyl isomerase [Salinirussus sp.]